MTIGPKYNFRKYVGGPPRHAQQVSELTYSLKLIKNKTVKKVDFWAKMALIQLSSARRRGAEPPELLVSYNIFR